MAKVLGIGGVSFKTEDAKALKAWYVRVLGIELTPWGGVAFPPLPKGKTAWSPFAADTDHFRPSTGPFMINFVVDDLEALLAKVRGEGVEVLKEEAMDGIGRFAWILDPGGMKVELWQPDDPTPVAAPA